MKLNFENLGPISDATFDLSKKLIVFCGQNNTGKTYASLVIYALLKTSYRYTKHSDKEELFINNLIKNNSAEIDIDHSTLWKYREDELQRTKNSLNMIFGISDELTEKLFSNFKLKQIEVNANKDEGEAKFEKILLECEFAYTINLSNVKLSITKVKSSTKVKVKINHSNLSKESIEIIELFLIERVYFLLAFYPISSSYALPVERNSIYTFSKELSLKKQEFLDQATDLVNAKKGYNPFQALIRRSTRYPMAIKDGLEIAEDLVNFSKTKSEFYYLAEEIENDLLNGKIELSKDGDVVFQSNKAKSKSKRLPIHLTASIVKSLSSLVFYLKYIAEHNELIIIDEPELNLHPNNQVIIARVFAKLINNGFRLLVSTHSDYIVRELNNLIMASTLDKKTLIENKLENYQNGYGINKADIGAYLFNYENPNSRKVNVKPIKIDKFGFEISTIDKTVDELNFNSNILYNLTIDHE